MEEQITKQNIQTQKSGIYIPPFLQRKLKEQENQSSEENNLQKQQENWDFLKKSINGIINKLNVQNIKNIIIELFNENLLRGKGLLAKSILNSQVCSINYSNVFAALLAVINSKLPDVVKILLHRLILQFRRSFKRCNKIQCVGSLKFIAHLVNQQVLHEIIALQILALFLENPTEDSVDLACSFMTECGQLLQEVSPQGSSMIFERFRSLIQNGLVSRRCQYLIENLFKIRKSKFENHPSVIPELDLVEEDEKITHKLSLDDEEVGSKQNCEDQSNIFKYDPQFEQNEDEWNEIKEEILGQEDLLQQNKIKEDLTDEENDKEEDNNQIQDMTEKDLINLRRTIYLVIMNSVDFEECCHKLLKLNIRENQQLELCSMIVECCMQERTFSRYYGLLAQRLCQVAEIYQLQFNQVFDQQFQIMHRHEVNKIRNSAKLFAHLLYTDSLDWSCLTCVKLTEEDTTSSSRIFIKILFQEIAENLGTQNFVDRLKNDSSIQPFLKNIFPTDNIENARFAVNFFTSIGLGQITEGLREFLEKAPKLLLEQKYAELLKQAQELNNFIDSDSDDSSSSDSDSSSESSSSQISKSKSSQKKPAPTNESISSGIQESYLRKRKRIDSDSKKKENILSSDSEQRMRRHVVSSDSESQRKRQRLRSNSSQSYVQRRKRRDSSSD